MADQVNPLGGLVPGRTQVNQAAASVSSKPSPKPAEPRPSAEDRRDDGVSSESLETAAQNVQDYLQALPVNVEFSVDKDTGRFILKVVNPTTEEVIRQVPSEEVVAMSRKLRELSKEQRVSGVLLDREG